MDASKGSSEEVGVPTSSPAMFAIRGMIRRGRKEVACRGRGGGAVTRLHDNHDYTTTRLHDDTTTRL
jgi:hypothetical protein